MPPLTFEPHGSGDLPLHLVGKEGWDDFRADLPDTARAWAEATGFSAASGAICLLPGPDGGIGGAIVGLGTEKDRRRTRFLLGKVRGALPKGTWYLATAPGGDLLEEQALAWLLGGYSFRRYRAGDDDTTPPGLAAPDGIDTDRLEEIAGGEALTRDLINTPASDMGPAELEQAARDLAAEFGAAIDVTTGQALLDNNFPLIHTVGRASPRDPRLIDMSWGDSGPRITLVGKGVCFDTGGLNLKPGSSMALMKKDMGGAATVLGLARMIMATGMAVRLRVLIPAVENALSGAAFRPGDILTSRKGLTVEINNTDAEGRLVLADALALASEDKPDLIVSMATLTGAARVAVGADIAPFYTDDDALADRIAAAGARVRDPVWRLPFHDPYEPQIEPGIADLDNAPGGGMAGSITAALFLRRFCDVTKYIHFDIYGWQRSAAPGRPKGGVGQGARALFEILPDLTD